MKSKIMVIGAVLVFSTVLAGCASNKDLIAKASINSSQDVFQEVQNTQTVAGKSVLYVEFLVKNYKTRLINSFTKHTDPPYTVTLNIDGQATVLFNEPDFEDILGDFNSNPEEGIGWKYKFKKTLVLQPGKHRIVIAVPLSDVIIEKEIELMEGNYVLKLTPDYKTSVTRNPNIPKFSRGLHCIAIKLNNKDI